jgi:hypothetical protein
LRPHAGEGSRQFPVRSHPETATTRRVGVDVVTDGGSTRGAQTTAAPRRPFRPLLRRYYPLAIGATFLGVVVGYFPSTVPTSSLGFMPLVTAPAHASASVPSAAAVAAPRSSSPVLNSLPVAGGGLPFGGTQNVAGAPVTTSPATTPTTGAAAGGGGTVTTGVTAKCPLPLPAEPTPPSAADLLEVYAAAGPFGPEATAGAALLAPVLPFVGPLLPLAAGFAGGSGGGILSTALVDVAVLEDKAFAPFASEIAAITPGAVSGSEAFYRDIGPLLSLASSLPDLNCVGDVEIATAATVAPADYPGALPLAKFGSEAAVNDPAVAVVEIPWAEGMTPGVTQAINQLIAQDRPVEVRLSDDPPAGHDTDASGFAKWVGTTVAQFPGVAMWEIDPYSAAIGSAATQAPADPAMTLVGALASAARARAPGQLLGVGIPTDAPAWWSQLTGALSPAVRSLVNFAGLDTTAMGGSGGLTAPGLHWVVSLVRQGMLAQAGFTADLPLVVMAGTDAPSNLAAQTSQAAQDAAALNGLGVGLLSWSSPSTWGGQWVGNGTAQMLLSALARRPVP